MSKILSTFKMKLCWIILYLHMVPLLCKEPGGRLRKLIKFKFSFDVKYPLSSTGCDLLLWQVSDVQEKFRPQQFHSINKKIHHFGSNDVYVILSLIPDYDHYLEGFTILSYESLHHFIIYYWIGSLTTLASKQSVATYAITLFTFMRQYYRLMPNNSPKGGMNREIENMESESFKRMIDLTNRNVPIPDNLGSYYQYLDSQFPTKRPNLYMVKGTVYKNYTKRIPLNGKWLKNNVCLIMETGLEITDLPSVTVYCGNNTPLDVQARAKGFSTVFRAHYINYQKGETAWLCNQSRRDPKFKAFIEIFENPYYCKADNSDDHSKDAESFINNFDASISLLRITSSFNENIGEPVTSVEPMLRGPNLQWNLQFDEIYLLDTKSPAGVFLVLGQYDQLCDRTRAIQYAELYLYENYTMASKPTHMRIMDINGSQRNDFSAFMIDFPWIMIDGLIQPHIQW